MHFELVTQGKLNVKIEVIYLPRFLGFASLLLCQTVDGKLSTFEEICTFLEDSLKAADKIVMKPVKVQKHVALALHWLASSSEYRSVWNLFVVAKYKVHDCVHKVCNLLIFDHILNDDIVILR